MEHCPYAPALLPTPRDNYLRRSAANLSDFSRCFYYGRISASYDRTQYERTLCDSALTRVASFHPKSLFFARWERKASLKLSNGKTVALWRFFKLTYSCRLPSDLEKWCDKRIRDKEESALVFRGRRWLILRSRNRRGTQSLRAWCAAVLFTRGPRVCSALYVCMQELWSFPN